MQCITPMVRLYNDVPKHTEDEKQWQKIVPRSQVFDNMLANENYLTRIQNRNKELKEKGSPLRFQLIPCRHCWACQLKYSAEWATRLTWECERYEHKYFITLTYDDEHLPIYDKMEYIDKDGYKHVFENDGTWTGGSLKPEDMTRFIKTIRKHFERKGIKDTKYFYCGEYGENSKRSHYHLILLGTPLDMTKFYDFHIDKRHKMHWKSKEIEKWWGKGMIDVAEVEWSSCAYVARYCMKKIDFENDPIEYAKQGKIKEFVRMSRRPGIGVRYFNENIKDIYENDEVIQKTVKGNTSSFKPPKAFDQRFKELYPEWWEEIKKSREEAAERNRIMQKEIYKGITDLEQNERNAQKVIKKGNWLPRSGDMDSL